ARVHRGRLVRCAPCRVELARPRGERGCPQRRDRGGVRTRVVGRGGRTGDPLRGGRGRSRGRGPAGPWPGAGGRVVPVRGRTGPPGAVAGGHVGRGGRRGPRPVGL